MMSGDGAVEREIAFIPVGSDKGQGIGLPHEHLDGFGP